MTDDRAPWDSVVRLGDPRPRTAGGAVAVLACWTLLVVGVLLVPAWCLLHALLTGGPIESPGPRPPESAGALRDLWAARGSATASALGVLALAVVFTARGGRLVNGWIVLVLSLPVVALLWALRLG